MAEIKVYLKDVDDPLIVTNAISSPGDFWLTVRTIDWKKVFHFPRKNVLVVEECRDKNSKNNL